MIIRPGGGSGLPDPIPYPGDFSTLPDYWAITGPAWFNPNPPPEVRQPLSGAIAPNLLLARAYGAVRVGGTALTFGPNYAFPYPTYATGIIVWSEGPIGGVVNFLCNGSIITQVEYGTSGYRHFAHYPGALPTNIATTDLQIFAPYGWTWWTLLPGGTEAGTFEWAADILGLLLFDPRDSSTAYSNNPVLEVRDLLANVKKLTDEEIDDASFATMAQAAEDAGLTCDIVFSEKTPLPEALGYILQACNGKLITVEGKTGISLDLPNAADPVASFSEEDGDIWGLKYEWLSARDRITRMAVSFFNQTANKNDVTPDFDDPGIALGTVPIRPLVVAARGIGTMDAAVILRDYLFNSQAIGFRASGMMKAKGILRSEGEKIHLKTLKGVDADFLLEQISGDDKGFFSFVVRPYDAAVWGTTPITIGPPIVPVILANVHVTDVAQRKDVLTSTDALHDYYDVFQIVEYMLPDAPPSIALDHLAVRASEDPDAQSETWFDMAASEITVATTGNETETDGTHFNLTHSTVRRGTRVVTYSTRPTVLTDVTTDKTTRIIIRSVSADGGLSRGVAVNFTAGGGGDVTDPPPEGTGRVTSPLIIPPSGPNPGQGGEVRMLELAANGTSGTGFLSPDSLGEDLRYILPSVAPTDGQLLAYDATVAGYPTWARPLVWTSIWGKVIALQRGLPRP